VRLELGDDPAFFSFEHFDYVTGDFYQTDLNLFKLT